MLFLFAWAALLAWISLSTLWSTDRAETVLEIERTLVYVSAAAMFVLACTRRSQRPLLGGLAVRDRGGLALQLGHTAVPERASRLRPDGGPKARTAAGLLERSLGVHGPRHRARARLRGSWTHSRGSHSFRCALVPLLATLYFTFGRSGWIALAAGMLVYIGLDRRPLRPLALLVALAPLLGLAVWLASRRPGLTHAHASLARATHDGHGLALRLVVLSFAAAAIAVTFWLVERRTTFPRSVKIAFASMLAVAFMTGAALAFAHYGGPVSLTQRAWRNFKAPSARAANLNKRLFTLSGNGRYQLWRIGLDDAGNHPGLGSGAGSYERYFLGHQPAQLGRVRDAHSLYVETLAELGPFGLALLVVVLGTPLAVAVKRRRPITAIAAGGYVVFLVHAATDWDWELPAVGLAAIVCAVAMLLGGRGARRAKRLSATVRTVAVAALAGAGIFAVVGLLGEQCARSEPVRPGRPGRSQPPSSRRGVPRHGPPGRPTRGTVSAMPRWRQARKPRRSRAIGRDCRSTGTTGSSGTTWRLRPPGPRAGMRWPSRSRSLRGQVCATGSRTFDSTWVGVGDRWTNLSQNSTACCLSSDRCAERCVFWEPC